MKKIFYLSLISLLSVILFSLSSAAQKPQFELLWSHDSRWEEHQTVKNGKVFCPMTTENPPNLKIVDLYTGEIEHIFDLEHRCGCAPWFVQNKVYLYAFKPINKKKPWPCVYVIDTTKWAIEHIWPINCGIDVEVCPYDKETNCFFLPTGCYKANSGKQVWGMKPSGRSGILQYTTMLKRNFVPIIK